MFRITRGPTGCILICATIIFYGCQKNDDYSYDYQWSADLLNTKREIDKEIGSIQVYREKIPRGRTLSKRFISQHSPMLLVMDPVKIKEFIGVVQNSTPNPHSAKIPKLADYTLQIVYQNKTLPNLIGYMTVYGGVKRTYVKPYSPSDSYYENNRIIRYIEKLAGSEIE